VDKYLEKEKEFNILFFSNIFLGCSKTNQDT